MGKISTTAKSLFLVRPRNGGNPYKFAKQVAGIRGVREILIGEGRHYGVAIEAVSEKGIEEFLRKNGFAFEKLSCIYSLKGVTYANTNRK
ncbi:MAG: hypothetical protein ACP5IK_03990 [Candidatus Micrarchaeia archaeon]|jgi:hypothetical protein